MPRCIALVGRLMLPHDPRAGVLHHVALSRARDDFQKNCRPLKHASGFWGMT